MDTDLIVVEERNILSTEQAAGSVRNDVTCIIIIAAEGISYCLCDDARLRIPEGKR